VSQRIPWLAWLPLVLGAVGVIYGMIGFWVRGYDNYDRAFILLASAWLVHSRHAELTSRPDTPRPRLGLALIVLGVIAYLPAWFVYAQIGPRPVILWWEALALLVATAGMILVRSGPRLLVDVRFMLVFPLFALPLPGRILLPMHEIMQSISADLGAALLPWIGVTIQQKIGNHIRLTNGLGIEVAEMCSGVVMIRTTLALAAYLAHHHKFTLIRSLILLACTLPVIVFVNALRVAAFGYLQDSGLTEWVQPGTRHEIVGYLAYIPGVLMVLFVVNRLKPAPAPATPVEIGSPAIPSPRMTWIATAVLVAGVAAALATLTAPGVGRSVGGDLSFDEFPHTLGNWNFLGTQGDSEEMQLARKGHMDLIRSKLTCNAELNRVYFSLTGARIDLWLLYWQSAMVVKDYHHPDICNTMQGFETVAASTEMLTTPAGRKIPMTVREIRRDHTAALVIYWTQEGRRLWGDADEAKARSFLFPIHWTRERLSKGRNPDDSDDRLQVYMTLPLLKTKPLAAQKTGLLEFTGLVADELYTRCPWADPGTSEKSVVK
jgi:EpsI family protein